MIDINPSYQPHLTTPKPLSFSRSASDSSTEGALKTLDQNTPLTNASKRLKDKDKDKDKDKEKEKEKAMLETGGGIMTFFRSLPLFYRMIIFLLLIRFLIGL